MRANTKVSGLSAGGAALHSFFRSCQSWAARSTFASAASFSPAVTHFRRQCFRRFANNCLRLGRCIGRASIHFRQSQLHEFDTAPKAFFGIKAAYRGIQLR